MPWPLEPTGLRAFAARPRDPDGGGAQAPAAGEPGPRRPLRPARPRPARGSSARSTSRAIRCSRSSARCRWPRWPWPSPTACRPGRTWSGSTTISNRVSAAGMAAVTLGADQVRKPFFCSGCPHNTSTRLPEGSRALAGIGCHYMASFSDPQHRPHQPDGRRGADLGGRRAVHHARSTSSSIWATAPTTTPARSPSAAPIAMGEHITYKLLFNDAVAMTGGQAAESGFTVPQITRQLAAEGVAKTVVVADDVSRYADGQGPRARRHRPSPRRPDRRAGGAARHARRHRPDLRPGLRHREAPPPQARHDGRRAQAGVHQLPGLRGLRRLLAARRTASRSSRSTPSSAASGGSTSRPATRTIPASTASAPRSSPSRAARTPRPSRCRR